MALKPTEEQLHCIATAKANQRTKINAIAGSGKSSTLVLIAKEIEVPSICLSFNKITASEAAAKFPRHVECRTTHSLAYEAFGRDMHHKLSRPKGRYVNVANTGGEIGKYYKISSIDVSTKDALATISQAYLGLMIKSTVAKFEQSASDTLSLDHLPWGDLKEIEKKHGLNAKNLGKDILGHAKTMWKDRTNLCSSVLTTPDTYLKLWQLSKPQLNTKVVYLDEAKIQPHVFLTLY